MHIEPTISRVASLDDSGNVHLKEITKRVIHNDDGTIEQLPDSNHRSVLDPRSKDYADKLKAAFIEGADEDSEVAKFLSAMLVSIESNRNKQLQADLNAVRAQRDAANTELIELKANA